MIRGRSWGRRRRVVASPLFDAQAVDQGNGSRSATLTSTATGTILASFQQLNGNTPTSIKCDGVDMTLVSTAIPTSGQGFVAVYKAVGVPAGSHTVAATTGDNYTNLNVVAYKGAGSVSAGVAVGGGGTAPTTGAQAVAAGEVLVSLFFTRLSSTVTSGVLRSTVNNASGFTFGRVVEGTGASPQTNALSQSNANYCVVSVKLSA